MRAALAPEALGRRTVCEGNLAQYPAPIGHISFPCPLCVTQLAGSLARRFANASVIHPRWIRCKTAFRFPNASPNAYAVGVPIPQSICITDICIYIWIDIYLSLIHI